MRRLRTLLLVVFPLVLGGCDPIETGLIDLTVVSRGAAGEALPVTGAHCTLSEGGAEDPEGLEVEALETDAEGRVRFSGAQVGLHTVRCLHEAAGAPLAGMVEVEVPREAGRPGWVEAVLSVAPLRAPMAVEAVARPGAVRVTWTPPGEVMVVGYRVRILPDGETSEVGADQVALEVTGLKPGARYAFAVAARTAFGLGPEAQTQEVRVPTVPGSPWGLSAVPREGSVWLEWVAPEDDGGSPILAYHVVTKPETAPRMVEAGVTRIEVRGLTPGTPYQFSVIAENAVGLGAPSDPSEEVTPAPGSGIRPLPDADG